MELSFHFRVRNISIPSEKLEKETIGGKEVFTKQKKLLSFDMGGVVRIFPWSEFSTFKENTLERDSIFLRVRIRAKG